MTGATSGTTTTGFCGGSCWGRSLSGWGLPAVRGAPGRAGSGTVATGGVAGVAGLPVTAGRDGFAGSPEITGGGVAPSFFPRSFPPSVRTTARGSVSGGSPGPATAGCAGGGMSVAGLPGCGRSPLPRGPWPANPGGTAFASPCTGTTFKSAASTARAGAV